MNRHKPIDNSKHSFFEECFDCYFERVVCYIFSYCKDREVAKNIAQDVFVTFWENIDKIDREKTPLPYLFFVAKNKTINVLKRNLVRGKFNGYVQKREYELLYSALESSTMENVFAKDVERLVSRSMQQMKPAVRETFYLSRFRCLKNEEIAKELDISVKTVEYRMSSALRIIKRNFKDLLLLVVGLLSTMLGNLF